MNNRILYSIPGQIASALVITILLSSCTSSSSTNRAFFPDPEFRDRGYGKILVSFESEALDLRARLETKLVEELDDRGVAAMRGLTLLAPTRTWDSTASRAMIDAAAIDARLEIRIIEEDRVRLHKPQKSKTVVETETETEGGEETKSGETGSKSSTKEKTTTTATTTVTGGYDYEKVYRRFEIRLVDVATGRSAWIGTIRVSGFPESYLSDKIADGLIEDRMVRVID